MIGLCKQLQTVSCRVGLGTAEISDGHHRAGDSQGHWGQTGSIIAGSEAMTSDPKNVPSDIDPETSKQAKDSPQTQRGRMPARSENQHEHEGSTEDEVQPVTPPRGSEF